MYIQRPPTPSGLCRWGVGEAAGKGSSKGRTTISVLEETIAERRMYAILRSSLTSR